MEECIKLTYISANLLSLTYPMFLNGNATLYRSGLGHWLFCIPPVNSAFIVSQIVSDGKVNIRSYWDEDVKDIFPLLILVYEVKAWLAKMANRIPAQMYFIDFKSFIIHLALDCFILFPFPFCCRLTKLGWECPLIPVAIQIIFALHVN